MNAGIFRHYIQNCYENHVENRHWKMIFPFLFYFLGFIDGSSSDEKCLARHTDITGRIKPANQVLYASTGEQLAEYLRNGLVISIMYSL